MLFAVRSGSGGDVLDHGAGDGIERLHLGGVAVWWWSRPGHWLRSFCFSPCGDPRNKSRWRYVDCLWLLLVDVDINSNLVPPQITRIRTRMCMWRADR